MVVSIRELVNIQTPTSVFSMKPIQMVFIPANIVMDIDNNFISERSNFSSKVSSRNTLVLSVTSSIPYYKRMEIKNDLPNKDIVNLIDNSQLSYKDNDNIGNSISKTTKIGSTKT